MSQIKDYLVDFLYLIFPDVCNACGQQLNKGEKHICIHCLYDLPFTNFESYKENRVAKLFWGKINCQTAMAMLYFSKGNKVQKLIHQIKYKSQTSLGIQMGKMLAERIITILGKVDLIIPVPLHFKKEQSRGYNQSKLIADGIAQVFNIPVCPHLLLRKVDTTSQTKKNRYSRFENMQSVFHAPLPKALEGKNVLLVDDVITTGATLEACGLILHNAGVNHLHIAALAFAE